MKRENIILSVFLTLGLIASISMFIANQGLKDALKEEEKAKSQIQGISRQVSTYPLTRKQTRELAAPKHKQEVKRSPSAEAEFDLSELSESDFKEIEKRQAEPVVMEEEEEASSTGTGTERNTLPSLDELRELKAKGVIMH